MQHRGTRKMFDSSPIGPFKTRLAAGTYREIELMGRGCWTIIAGAMGMSPNDLKGELIGMEEADLQLDLIVTVCWHIRVIEKERKAAEERMKAHGSMGELDGFDGTSELHYQGQVSGGFESRHEEGEFAAWFFKFAQRICGYDLYR